MHKNLLCLAFLSLLFVNLCFSALQSNQDNEIAKELLEKAAQYVKEVGSEKAIKEFNNPKGSFISGKVYLVVYDLSGKLIANPVSPHTVGKSLADDLSEGDVFPPIGLTTAIIKEKDRIFKSINQNMALALLKKMQSEQELHEFYKFIDLNLRDDFYSKRVGDIIVCCSVLSKISP